MKIIELFSGIGGFTKGFEEAGYHFEEHYFSEIDKHAIANYKYNFPNAKHIGSVTDIPNGNFTGIDLITFGSPCFVRDTKVLTDKGYINIQEVKIGDKVLTHNGNWCNVYQINEKEHQGYIHTLKFGKDTETIKCTPEHPFYVVKKQVVYNSKRRNYDIIWSEPFWIEAQYLDKNHYVVTANQKENIRVDIAQAEAYLLGYYLAEGYLDKTIRKRDNKSMYRIFFSMHEKEKNHFSEMIKNIEYKGRFNNKKAINFYFDDKFEGKASKGIISNERLYKLCESIGRGSKNKKVPNFILSANIDIQKSFLKGYMYGDGCYIESSKTYQCQSKNIEMAYGIRHLVLRVYNELPSIFFTKVKSTKIINGRTVKQTPYFSIKWKIDKSRESFSYKVNNNIVVKVISNEKRISNESVFNFSVERDNTYIVGNYVVHNCQDFSLAGQRKGLNGDRSSLVKEAIRLIADIRPSIFIWENVKGAFSSNAGADFAAILQEFANIGGYRLEWQLLNTKWFLPQNRERIYLVGHLATTERSFQPIFPIGENEEIFNRATRQKSRECSNKETTHSRTITSRMHKMGSDDTYIKVPNIAGTLTGGGNSGGLHSDMTTIQVGTWREFQGEEGIRPMKDNICPTLLARARKDGSGQTVVSDKTNIRRLTEIECERLQGFPDNWTKYGNYNGEIKEISVTQRYKMIGNAVSVPVVKEIAKRLKN